MSELQSKRTAGRYAAGLIRDGMRVGLGAGSTAREFVQALGERVACGLEITAVASSAKTAKLAVSLDIPLVQLDGPVDLAVDGADLIETPTLHAIKGLGGALVREKLIALAAREFILIADASKLSPNLGDRRDDIPISVEIVPFGWKTTCERLSEHGKLCLRRTNGEPFVSDNQNYVADLFGYPSLEPPQLAAELKRVAGVVDHGLFIDLATRAIIGRGDQVEVLKH